MAAHPTMRPIGPEAAHSLALAVIASSNAPLVLLDGRLAIIAASATFCTAFGVDAREVVGRQLADIGAREWDVPQLASLLRATASGLAAVEAYEFDFIRAGRDNRRLILNAQKIDYADADNIRLVLSVSDVTDARLAEKLKDDMLREKAILLQELQHRVANSLQIIASVLLQSARRVDSKETRGHLHDAHHRVMSVAAVQRQLAASTLGEVEMRSYLTNLCSSIGDSMIHDRKLVSLTVKADDTVTTANVSLSLGLIVTELVINALKHAFPGGRRGKILVDYHSEGDAWTLSVEDNGIGMPAGFTAAKAGLGTSIVKALASKLDAQFVVAEGKPGTDVSIVHATV